MAEPTPAMPLEQATELVRTHIRRRSADRMSGWYPPWERTAAEEECTAIDTVLAALAQAQADAIALARLAISFPPLYINDLEDGVRATELRDRILRAAGYIL